MTCFVRPAAHAGKGKLVSSILHLSGILLISNDCSRPRGGQALSGQPGEMDSEMQGEDESGPTAAVSGEQLGPQARRLLAVPELVTHVLLPGLFQCLSVPDSQASRKAAELVGPTMQAVRFFFFSPELFRCIQLSCYSRVA